MKIRIEQLQEIGIPERYQFEDVTSYLGKPEALEQVNKYLKKFQYAYDNGLGLVLYGEQNSQKTLLLCHALKVIAAKGFNCQYVTPRNLVDAEMNKNKPYGSSTFSRLVKEPQLLCVDCLEEGLNSLELQFLRQALKIRIDDSRPTLIGTRIVPEAFATALGSWFPVVVEGYYLTVECYVEPHRWHKSMQQKKSALEI